MLVIRNAQMNALAAARLAVFEDKMLEHLQKVYPEWAASLGTDRLRGFVRHGMDRARRYGFEVELDIARYLHAMHDLNEHFDESPEFSWAAKLLAANAPAEEKMNRLRDAVEYHLEARRIGRAR